MESSCKSWPSVSIWLNLKEKREEAKEGEDDGVDFQIGKSFALATLLFSRNFTVESHNFTIQLRVCLSAIRARFVHTTNGKWILHKEFQQWRTIPGSLRWSHSGRPVHSQQVHPHKHPVFVASRNTSCCSTQGSEVNHNNPCAGGALKNRAALKQTERKEEKKNSSQRNRKGSHLWKPTAATDDTLLWRSKAQNSRIEFLSRKINS